MIKILVGDYDAAKGGYKVMASLPNGFGASIYCEMTEPLKTTIAKINQLIFLTTIEGAKMFFSQGQEIQEPPSDQKKEEAAPENVPLTTGAADSSPIIKT